MSTEEKLTLHHLLPKSELNLAIKQDQKDFNYDDVYTGKPDGEIS